MLQQKHTPEFAWKQAETQFFRWSTCGWSLIDSFRIRINKEFVWTESNRLGVKAHLQSVGIPQIHKRELTHLCELLAV